MARLLVSVRSAQEAISATGAGAAIIDVKEPRHGSLGRASPQVWQEVRDACPAHIPVSVALGELTEWLDPDSHPLSNASWSGISFRKLGLAGTGADGIAQWSALAARPEFSGGPHWIAVAYADWHAARAPDPNLVLRAACEGPSVAGILIDTFDKSRKFRPDTEWTLWAERVRQSGLLLAVAGGIGLSSIDSLEPLAPHIVAVRGAACEGGCRTAAIDPNRVAELVQRVATLPATDLAILNHA